MRHQTYWIYFSKVKWTMTKKHLIIFLSLADAMPIKIRLLEILKLKALRDCWLRWSGFKLKWKSSQKGRTREMTTDKTPKIKMAESLQFKGWTCSSIGQLNSFIMLDWLDWLAFLALALQLLTPDSQSGSIRCIRWQHYRHFDASFLTFRHWPSSSSLTLRNIKFVPASP